MRRQHYDLSFIPMPLVGYFDEDCRLPDSVEGIEAGRQPRLRQGELFPDSTMSRLKAVKATESK